jgi:HEAT repeat protein
MFERLYIVWLQYKLSLLGRKATVFPIEILSLSRRIADLKSRKSAYRLIRQFHEHQNFYVRRAVVIAVRFIGREGAEQCLDLLLRSTNDREAWVRYDALWALGEAGIRDERIRSALLRHASEYVDWTLERLEGAKAKEPEQQAKIRAAESLRMYERVSIGT